MKSKVNKDTILSRGNNLIRFHKNFDSILCSLSSKNVEVWSSDRMTSWLFPENAYDFVFFAEFLKVKMKVPMILKSEGPRQPLEHRPKKSWKKNSKSNKKSRK